MVFLIKYDSCTAMGQFLSWQERLLLIKVCEIQIF